LQTLQAAPEAALGEVVTPNLDNALEALGYWIQRRTRLPFHHRAALREGARVTMVGVVSCALVPVVMLAGR